MARVNTKHNYPTTHEGAVAALLSPEQQLRRSVMACFLWEDTFYESGQAIADRIGDLVKIVPAQRVAQIAVETRSVANLRHVPLLLAAHLAKPNAGSVVRDTLPLVVQRADELAEFLAIYAKVYGIKPDKLKPHLSAQVKKGLGQALRNFDEYELSKYNRNDKGQQIKLKDVLALCHPRPLDPAQATLWKRVLDGNMAIAETWDNEMIRDSSATGQGKDKKEVFTKQLQTGKLPYMALLRNLRNMEQAGVDRDLVANAILARKGGARRVLPFRYVSAMNAAPSFAKELDSALMAAIGESAPFPGKTIVVVDASGSMDSPVSGKSQIRRVEAGGALAGMINGNVRLFAFGDTCREVPHRLGLSNVLAIKAAGVGHSTRMGNAVHTVNRLPHDRLIVITDEQSQDVVPDPVAKHAYVINVAAYQNGVGYDRWVHIDGFSEATLKFIREYEAGGF